MSALAPMAVGALNQAFKLGMTAAFKKPWLTVPLDYEAEAKGETDPNQEYVIEVMTSGIGRTNRGRILLPDDVRAFRARGRGPDEWKIKVESIERGEPKAKNLEARITPGPPTVIATQPGEDDRPFGPDERWAMMRMLQAQEAGLIGEIPTPKDRDISSAWRELSADLAKKAEGQNLTEKLGPTQDLLSLLWPAGQQPQPGTRRTLSAGAASAPAGAREMAGPTSKTKTRGGAPKSSGLPDPVLWQLAEAGSASVGGRIPPSLIRAMIQRESGGDPRAGSPAGAQGLMQLMPGTAEGLGVKNVHDPRQNVMGGVKYLQDQLDTFKSIELALSAYNSGPAGSEPQGEIESFKETQDYVKRVIALERQYRQMMGSEGMGPMGQPPSVNSVNSTGAGVGFGGAAEASAQTGDVYSPLPFSGLLQSSAKR